MSPYTLTNQYLKKKQPKLASSFSVKLFFKTYISALKAKALFFNYPLSVCKTASDFLVCLEKNRRIAGYKFFPQNQMVRVFLIYELTQDKPLLPQVTFYTSQGRTRNASFKKLLQFHMQNPTAFTLIGTKFGILDLKSCLLHKCGGKFLISLT